MDRIKAMELFVRVAERGSFSAVAREMQTSQSTVSKQVFALEQAIGVELLARTTRSLSLTSAGERYFERARRLVTEIVDAENFARSSERHLGGLLRVASTVSFGRLKLLPVIHAFQDSHPELQVELRVDDRHVDLVEEGIDVAVRMGEIRDQALVARPVGTLRRVVVAGRRYVEALQRAGRRLPEVPEDLREHNCIVFTELATQDLWRFVGKQRARAGEDEGVEVRVRSNLRTNSGEVLRAAVLAGRGIGFGPLWLFREGVEEGELNILLRDWTGPPSPIHLVSPPHCRKSAKVQAFVEHVTRTMVWE